MVFDPNTIQDHATYDKPHQLSTGVSYVIVNGKLAIKDGEPTGAATGRVVRGRAWTGAGRRLPRFSKGLEVVLNRVS